MGGRAGGRPREQGRRPACPDGHDGVVWFHGFRRRDDSLYARPRYECVHQVCDASCRTDCAKPHAHTRWCPRKCDGTHTFTGPEQARTHRHPDGLWCRECDRSRTKRDGTPVANDWDFEARLIAEALMAVGSGASFRQAAEAMRISARRIRHDAQGIAYTSREGETVARYLDHFGPLLTGLSEHDAWPEVLVLDAHPLRRREASPDDPFSFEEAGNGALLFALGYTSPVPRRREQPVKKWVPWHGLSPRRSRVTQVSLHVSWWQRNTGRANSRSLRHRNPHEVTLPLWPSGPAPTKSVGKPSPPEVLRVLVGSPRDSIRLIPGDRVSPLCSAGDEGYASSCARALADHASANGSRLARLRDISPARSSIE
jgi:hypothetical protein